MTSEPIAGDPLGAHLGAAAVAGAGEAIADATVGTDREAADMARKIGEAAAAAADALRRRAAAAQVELGRRRAEAASREEARDLPGARAIALELAKGAARLLRTLLLAPLRVALAVLWPREA
jgi:hypothetical protein